MLKIRFLRFLFGEKFVRRRDRFFQKDLLERHFFETFEEKEALTLAHSFRYFKIFEKQEIAEMGLLEYITYRIVVW